jgi:hypothetical protein
MDHHMKKPTDQLVIVPQPDNKDTYLGIQEGLGLGRPVEGWTPPVKKPRLKAKTTTRDIYAFDTFKHKEARRFNMITYIRSFEGTEKIPNDFTYLDFYKRIRGSVNNKNVINKKKGLPMYFSAFKDDNQNDVIIYAVDKTVDDNPPPLLLT